MAGQKADVIIHVKLALNRAKKDLTAYRKKVTNMGRVTATQMKGLDSRIKTVAASTKRLTSLTQKAQIPFQAWALSIMFFGMAMQRVFSQIWKASTATFNEVMHSVAGTVTGFDMLTGSLKYLQFTAGQALEPLAYHLFPIIDAISAWIEDNQTLFRTLLTIVGVLGTFLMVTGTLVLGILGVVTAAGMVGTAFTAIKVAVGLAFAGAGLTITAFVALVLGVLVVIAAAWHSNFGGFRDFVKGIFTAIWATVKSVFKNIIEIFKGIWMIIKGIFTGDFQMVLDGASKIVKNFVAGVIKIFWGLAAAIGNVFVIIVNMIKDAFFGLITFFAEQIKGLILIVNKIPGVDISTGGIDSAIANIKALQDKLTLKTLTGEQITNGLAGVDVLLGTGANEKQVQKEQKVQNNNITVNVEGDADESKIESAMSAVLAQMEAFK